MTKQFKIGKHSFSNNLVLAPMAGITDAAYRAVASYYGAGMTVSEMILANRQSLLAQQEKLVFHSRNFIPDLAKFRQLVDTNLVNFVELDLESSLLEANSATPRVVQLLGNDATEMADLARLICEQDLADIIDINMGCPAKKVTKKLAGSALLADLALVEDILGSIIKVSDREVTLKMRTGVSREQKKFLTIGKLAQDLGISAITLHGRTREDLYKGYAEYDSAKALKQALEIPLIVNGDINSVLKYQLVADYTKADALMFGRSSQGNPWLFAQLNSYLQEQPYSAVSIKDKFITLMLHLALLHQTYPDTAAVNFSRKNFIWYLEQIFPQVFKLKTANNLESGTEISLQTNLEQQLAQIRLANPELLESYSDLDSLVAKLERLFPSYNLESDYDLNNSVISYAEEIKAWKSQFLKLTTAQEQRSFLADCFTFIVNKICN